MIKLMLLLTRKPGMSFAEFRDYYESRHVPLASSFATPLLRYKRNYVEATMLGAPECDCITEVWYDVGGQWQEQRSRIVSPEMSALIAADEENFLDRPATRIVVVEESESIPESLPGSLPAHLE
jgi:uncharacterized protein (TIGR02118 family)